jgi:hypothetical protein
MAKKIAVCDTEGDFPWKEINKMIQRNNVRNSMDNLIKETSIKQIFSQQICQLAGSVYLL